jgi:alpha/beta superfamily hydrolase
LPARPPLAAAVICHAHPLHGGIMHFKPVFRTAKALQSAGLAALRFNFRGVGASEGSHDGGVGEEEDARAALAELERRLPGCPLLLGGFSFGAGVSLRLALREPRVAAVLALGYPLRRPADGAPLDELRLPRLFVQGERDEFGPGAELRAALGELPSPSRVVVIPEADHYFTGRLDALQAAVAGWVGEGPWRATASRAGAIGR